MNSYWSGTGNCQELLLNLEKLIPRSGTLPNPKSKNKQLDALRRKINTYYDIYNNGGDNVGYTTVKNHFGVRLSKLGMSEVDFEVINLVMDVAVIGAAVEQKMFLTPRDFDWVRSMESLCSRRWVIKQLMNLNLSDNIKCYLSVVTQ